MAGTKITTTSSIGVKITASSQNPVDVTATGTIVTDGNYALYDATTTAGTITNDGFLDSKSTSGTGVIEAAAGSLLTNNGTITGGGSGVYMIGGGAIVTNLGTINGMATSNGDGVALGNGGTITNGASGVTGVSISGGNDGILSEANGGTVTNYGTVSGRGANGIKFESGNGTIANDGAASLISGAVYGVVINDNGTISNEGTVTGQGGAGIYIGGQGIVSNGDATHSSGKITGGSYGVFTGGRNSTLTNFGTVDATTTSGIGISLNQGGVLHNGSGAAPGATIHGGLDGVRVHAYGAAIVNYGTISGADGIGVQIDSTGGGIENVINGNDSSANFLISGNTYGVSLGGSGSVHNGGTITAISGAGVYVAAAGKLTNGNASQLGRVISGGRYGVYIGGLGTVTNFGSISGTNSSGMGVELKDGGTLQNGSAAANGATIIGGQTGVLADNGSASITNFGTLTGTGLYGVFIKNNGGTNSVANKAGALIKGVTGVSFGGSGTLTNAGTITGTGGAALGFSGTHDTLVVDPGAVFNGTVNGGGATNTLAFAAGKGTAAKIGTAFAQFGTVAFNTNANWSLTAGNTAASLVNNGTLTLAAKASLDITGSITAASTGIFQLSAGSTLDIASDTGAKNSMRFLGKAELIVEHTGLFGTHVGTSSYTGPKIEKFVAGDTMDLKNVAFAGAAFTYTASTGLLQMTSGSSHASFLFQTSTLGSGSFHIADDGSGHVLLTHS